MARSIQRLAAQSVADISAKRAMLGKRVRSKLPRPPHWLFPRNSENLYRRELLSIVDLIEANINNLLLPRLTFLHNEVNQLRPTRTDDFLSDINSIFLNINTVVDNKRMQPSIIATGIGNDISLFNRKEFNKTTHKVFGVNIFNQEPWLKDQLGLFAQQNADFIKDLSDKALNDIQGIVQRGLAQGINLSTLTEQVTERIGVTARRAKFIARDQTAKLNGQLTQLRQQELGIGKYQWATVGDERVRPSHAEKNGRIFSWDDPPADTGHPGQDFNCRCSAIPVFEKQFA